MKSLAVVSCSFVVFLLAECALGDEDDNAQSDPRMQSAQKFIEDFIRLGRSFDPKMADTYSDTARIASVRVYPGDKRHTLEMDGKKYKALVRQAMPLAKARGDRDSYSEFKFDFQGDRIRVKATRHSELKDYDSPVEWLLAPRAGGGWEIVEEINETQVAPG